MQFLFGLTSEDAGREKEKGKKKIRWDLSKRELVKV